MFQKVLAFQQRHFARDRPDLASTYSNIGCVLGDMGKYPEALDMCHQALDIDIMQGPRPGHVHSHTATTEDTIGLCSDVKEGFQRRSKYAPQGTEDSHNCTRS